MKTYAGIDLHSSNNYIGVIDAKDKRLYSKRHNNRIEDVLKVMGKFMEGYVMAVFLVATTLLDAFPSENNTT